MAVKDIILDDDLDLLITDGDLTVSYSDEQHMLIIVNTSVGSFKQAPLMGVGITQYISSSGQTDALRRSINIQLAADGYKVNEVAITGLNETFEYSIDAERN
jgi:hypothetical protein